MKEIPLGPPLLLTAAGTLLSLALPSKRGHVACGLLWAGLSALHAWRYREKLAQDFKRNGRLFTLGNIPQSKYELLVRAARVAAYIPGRARLYARALVGNEALARGVEAELAAASGITGVRANTTTGSVLIEYDPATLRRDPELARMEDYIRAHAKRK